MTTTPAPRVLSGRYELAHLVARGGMAEVYRAHDRLLDRPVALKILFPELSVDRSFVERFRREAQAAANLSHPNIVPVFDWGEDGGTYFIVMEFVDGRALSPILRSAGPLHPDRAAEIAADVAGALAYAHRHGVIHRDVKPGNVLITEEGIVKVTDFGIARAVNTEESLTQTGAVMGTATYFSPEQAEGMGVDARSDIYSLGVVLFEMVTGRPPFLGDTPVAVASKHVREHPPTPRDINPAVPPDLEAIILKCMSKSPDNRYSTGDEFRVDLLRFREGRSVSAVTGATPTGSTRAMGAVGHTQTLPQVTAMDYAEEPRSRTGLYAGILVVLLAALVVVVVFLGQSLGWWHLGSSNTSFALPGVAGQNLAQAERTLQADGLKTTQQSDSSSNASNTLVLRTDPARGTSVHKGDKITIITGSMGNTVMVPSVINFSITEAKSALQTAGLQGNVEPSTSCTMLNVVCSQNPPAGQAEPPGSTINLFTAAATTTTTTSESAVPNVTGDSVAQACSKLGNQGFSCSSTQNPVASSFPNGTVVSTTPAAGTVQPPGTSVTLNVSSGPAQVYVPDVIGDTEEMAETALQNDNLTPVVSCQTSSTTQDSVVAQNPQGGEQVNSGSTVTITVEMMSCTGGTTTTTS